MAELSAQYDIHPNQITQWKQQLLKNVSQLFSKGQQSQINVDETVTELQAKIGQLTVENEFLVKVLEHGWKRRLGR